MAVRRQAEVEMPSAEEMHEAVVVLQAEVAKVTALLRLGQVLDVAGRLRATYDQLTAAVADLEAQQMQLSRALEHQRHEGERREDEQRAVMAALEDKHLQAVKDFKQAEADMQTQLAQTQAELNGLRAAMRTQQAQALAEVTAAVAQERQKYVAEFKDLDMQKALREKELRDLEAQREDTRAQNDAVLARIRALEAQRDELRAQTAAAEARLKELEAAR